MSASTHGLVLTGAFPIDSLDWYMCLVIICNEDCYCRKYTTGDLLKNYKLSYDSERVFMEDRLNSAHSLSHMTLQVMETANSQLYARH